MVYSTLEAHDLVPAGPFWRRCWIPPHKCTRLRKPCLAKLNSNAISHDQVRCERQGSLDQSSQSRSAPGGHSRQFLEARRCSLASRYSPARLHHSNCLPWCSTGSCWVFLMSLCVCTNIIVTKGTTLEMSRNACRSAFACWQHWNTHMPTHYQKCLGWRPDSILVRNFRLLAPKANCRCLPTGRTTTRTVCNECERWAIFSYGGTHSSDGETTTRRRCPLIPCVSNLILPCHYCWRTCALRWIYKDEVMSPRTWSRSSEHTPINLLSKTDKRERSSYHRCVWLVRNHWSGTVDPTTVHAGPRSKCNLRRLCFSASSSKRQPAAASIIKCGKIWAYF